MRDEEVRRRKKRKRGETEEKAWDKREVEGTGRRYEVEGGGRGGREGIV